MYMYVLATLCGFYVVVMFTASVIEVHNSGCLIIIIAIII